MKYFETPRCTCCLSNNQNFCKLTHWTPSCHHVETSQLNCSANQLIGFYMINTLVLNDLSLTNGFLETKFWSLLISILWGDPFSTYKKLTFLTPWYAHVRVRIRGYEILTFRKISWNKWPLWFFLILIVSGVFDT